MNNKDLRIGNLFRHSQLGVVEITGINAFGFYCINAMHTTEEIQCIGYNDLEPIEISEEYLLDFGFAKEVQEFDEFEEVYYALECKNVFFVYADDWSLSIADSRESYEYTPNYITPDTELTNKVNLWQNIFKSLTGKDIYVREYW